MEVSPPNIIKMTFTTNCFYHVYNRGVEKRDIFNEQRDYQRFVHCLYEFNDYEAALPYNFLVNRKEILSKNRPRDILVHILSFCLMPNHFHLILQQVVDSGITKFMRKLGTGWTMYFNEKYDRSGVLFQGKFKAILIETDEYMLHLSRYIHLNPLELIEPKWKCKGLKNYSGGKDFLTTYRWSSLQDYIGINNFPSVTQREFIQNFFETKSSYEDFIFSFTEKDIPEIESYFLE